MRSPRSERPLVRPTVMLATALHRCLWRQTVMQATLMIGSAGRLAALLLLMLALVVLVPGCAAQSNPGALPAADAQATMRIHIVRHGWHSGIVVRAVDVPEHAWPARREFIGAEHLEVGWGDRAYYPAPDPSLWLGLRALLWPTAGVLHMVAFRGPVEHYFASCRDRRPSDHAAGFRAAGRRRLGQPRTRCRRSTDPARAGALWHQSLLRVARSIPSVCDLQCVGRRHAARGGRARQSGAVADLGGAVRATAPPCSGDPADAVNPRRQGDPQAFRRKRSGQTDGTPNAAKWTTHSRSGLMATSAAASAS